MYVDSFDVNIVRTLDKNLTMHLFTRGLNLNRRYLESLFGFNIFIFKGFLNLNIHVLMRKTSLKSLIKDEQKICGQCLLIIVHNATSYHTNTG